MASKIVDSWWFCNLTGDCIGIIKTEDEVTKEIKFRIGNGQGINEDSDAEFIKNYGSQFYPEQIK